MAIQVSRAPSGLRVVTEPMPTTGSVSIGFWVGTGSRDEEPSGAGASHFLEHLLFKGTERRTAAEIAEAIEAVGGEMNAFTTKEYTAFYVRVLEDFVELAMDLLCDIVWQPAFRSDDVECERQVILEELLMHADEPADVVHDLFFQALYPGHPLGADVLGTEATVSGMTRDQIHAFFAVHYRPVNMVAAVAGALDHDRAVAAIDARFAGLEGGGPPVRTAPAAAPRAVAVLTRPTEQAHLVVGLPALHRADPDRYALAMVDHALAGGTSSRLFQEIRERRGLAYAVYSSRAAFQDSGALTVYVGTAPHHVREVMAIVGDELERLRRKGITPRELQVAKGNVRGGLVLGHEDSAARMARIARSLLVHDEVPSLEEVCRRIDAVTLEDTARVIETILSQPAVVAAVGPFDEDALDPLQVV